MAPQVIHLPDGQTFTVKPIFAGWAFRSHELNVHASAFPVGWTVVLNTEDDAIENGADRDRENDDDDDDDGGGIDNRFQGRRAPRTRPFSQPTLQGDRLFISSVTNPPSSEFKPAPSPTRQIAMMLWVTLYWYFHQQPAPSPYLPPTASSAATPESARPRGEWRIGVRRQGVLAGRYLMPKLERMGLVASADTSVCAEGDGDGEDDGDGWRNMFVSRRMFWQIPARLFLFTLQPAAGKNGSSVPGSPIGSRPQTPNTFDASSPARLHYLHTSAQTGHRSGHRHTNSEHAVSYSPSPPPPPTSAPGLLATSSSFPVGPFYSTSHLPTYYPPAPLQYVFSDAGVRHPLRPKPPRMGEVFYSRFVPSAGRYLSFRVASSSPHPVPHLGPVGPKETDPEHDELLRLSDAALLQRWLGNSRVQRFWGGYSPGFLRDALSRSHSFPAIGLWDGVPFGYFEIYWVREDVLGQRLGSSGGGIDDWDRGLHVLVGEEWARGQVQAWLSSLVHWCLCADFRTMRVCLEPRVDNERFIQHLEHGGFMKQRQVSFPHKQSWLLRLERDTWEGPSF